MALISPDRRKALVDELLLVMNVAKAKVIVYAIFAKACQLVRLKNTPLAGGLIALGISIVVCLATWLINRIASLPISVSDLLNLLIPALVTGVCLWLVRVVEESMLIKNMNLFTEMPADEETFLVFIQDFRAKFRYTPQILFAVLFGVIGLLTAIAVCAGFSELARNIGFFTGITLASAAIGVGAYFAIMLPTIVVTLANHRVVLFPYNPAQSKMVVAGMSIVGNLTLGTGIAATIIMVLLFVGNPWGMQTTFWVALIWLAFIWGLTTYTFVIPFVYMSKAIVREKQLQIERINGLIKQLDDRLSALNKDELEQLQKLIELRQQICQTRNSPVETSSFRDYITSLIIPTVSFVIGSFDTLRGLMGRFLPR